MYRELAGPRPGREDGIDVFEVPFVPLSRLGAAPLPSSPPLELKWEMALAQRL